MHKNAQVTLIRRNSAKKNRTVFNFFSNCKEKSIFYDSYDDICEKNLLHPVEFVKLCNFLEKKHVLTFKEIERGGEDKIKIERKFLKVETLPFKMKKKFFKYDNFSRRYAYLNLCEILILIECCDNFFDQYIYKYIFFAYTMYHFVYVFIC